MGAAHSPTAVQRTRATERQLQALQLRLDGLALPEIARILGVRKQTAFEYLQRAVTARKLDILERGDELRAIEADKLDAAAKALWSKVKAGDPRAQDTWLRNRQRYAALLGLDLKPPDVTVDQSQNVIVVPAWGEQPAQPAPDVEGEARELPREASDELG